MTTWIDSVTAKLHAALAHAAAGEHFDWDKLVPEPWPTLSTTEHNTNTIGAALIAMPRTPAAIREALEYDEDIFLYGWPDTRALQEMAQSTLYSRQQWLHAWTRSYRYRTAQHRGELPVLNDWLGLMRHTLPGRSLASAASIVDLIGMFADLGEVLRRTAVGIVELALQMGLPPCRVGRGPCFCHPKPFPAGRDYRRRTKHRRRRQR